MRSVSPNNRTRNLNFIDETLPGLQSITNEYLKQFRSKKLQGKIEFTRLSENTWKMSSTLAGPTRN